MNKKEILDKKITMKPEYSIAARRPPILAPLWQTIVRMLHNDVLKGPISSTQRLYFAPP